MNPGQSNDPVACSIVCSNYPRIALQSNVTLLPYEIKRIHQDRFRIFTHILIKYLEQKDSLLAGQVRDILKEKHIGTALLDRLKKTVGEWYWQRSEAFTDYYLKAKAKAGSTFAQRLIAMK